MVELQIRASWLASCGCGFVIRLPPSYCPGWRRCVALCAEAVTWLVAVVVPLWVLRPVHMLAVVATPQTRRVWFAGWAGHGKPWTPSKSRLLCVGGIVWLSG